MLYLFSFIFSQGKFAGEVAANEKKRKLELLRSEDMSPFVIKSSQDDWTEAFNTDKSVTKSIKVKSTLRQKRKDKLSGNASTSSKVHKKVHKKKK